MALLIGCHLSNARGYLAMAKEAVSIHANTAQFFTRNPRGGRAKALDLSDIASYHTFAEAHHLSHLLAHAPYTINACSSDARVRQFAKETMADDLSMLSFFPGCCYNFHPGNHMKQGAAQGVALIADMLNDVLTPDLHTTVLLETMAGKGTEVGHRFEELRAIFDGVRLQHKMGVCLDTCHVWDSGYDIVHRLDAVLEEFDQIIGLSRLRAVHLNDSMNPRGSRKDRHAKIGQGQIGLDALVRILNHPKLRHLPFYLETPNDLAGYAEEISLLQRLYTPDSL
ncbi:MAG: deoxyribonuclease IV [Oscillospiraceae bacterium]|jgi:deoxyribonuclease-4